MSMGGLSKFRFAIAGALPPSGSRCLVGIEACATAHHWARELTRLGHQVRLMPAKDVKAYVKRNKNDAADAAAICEAVRRPTMRFVRIKSTDQQCQLMQHRTRDLMMRQRTQLINALRAHLAELGIVAGCDGRQRVTELLMRSWRMRTMADCPSRHEQALPCWRRNSMHCRC